MELNTPLEYLEKSLLQAFGPLSVRNRLAAVATLKEGLAKDPSNEKLLCLLSELELLCGNAKEALSIAQRAHDVKKGAVTALALGRAYLALNQTTEAHQYFTSCRSDLSKCKPELLIEIDRLIFRTDPFWSRSIQGRLVALKRVTQEHFDFILDCRKNGHFHEQYNFFQKSNEDSVKADIKRSLLHPLESKKIDWVVFRDNKPIGLAAFVEINIQSLRAEFLIGFPGKPSPLASVEASLLALDFAFNKMKLRKVYSYVYSNNIYSHENTLHLGFFDEGCLRQHVANPATSEPLDLYVHGILQEEFNELKLKNKLYKRFLS